MTALRSTGILPPRRASKAPIVNEALKGAAMRHISISSLFIAFILICITACSSSENHPAKAMPTDSFMRSMNESMKSMDDAMMSAPMSGDADHDFAAMMIPHHQGAVDMARLELLYGKDKVLQRLAQEIIVTQQDEIAAMNRQLVARGELAVQPQNPVPIHLDVVTGNDLQIPWGRPSVPISSHDRLYTADQTSNTVSVIDPSTNKLLGQIKLGDPIPAALSPLYRGELLVHGLGISPDAKTLAVVSVGSNSVNLIDTATNQPRAVVRVGRSPHEAFFTPDGSELWVTVRGQDYVSVIDPREGKEIRQIKTNNGPGMVMFPPNGKYAFVPSSFTPEVCVVDVGKHEVIARLPQPSPFCPNLACTPDGKEIWYTLKDTGKTVRISAEPPFAQLGILDTGPITNHVNFAQTSNGLFAYISIGGLNQLKVYSVTDSPKLVATIPTGDLPHGVWPSGDGTRIYVGLENSDALQVIDTQTNQTLATIPVGQTSQAIIYAINAVPEGQDPAAHLQPLAGATAQATHLKLSAAPNSPQPQAQATVAVNSLGPTDLLQIAAAGLEPGKIYKLYVVQPAANGQPESRQLLADLKTNPAGAVIGQAIGLLRTIGEAETSTPHLIVTTADNQLVLEESSEK
jgi:YVTN family beta-propeller protein